MFHTTARRYRESFAAARSLIFGMRNVQWRHTSAYYEIGIYRWAEWKFRASTENKGSSRWWIFTRVQMREMSYVIIFKDGLNITGSRRYICMWSRSAWTISFGRPRVFLFPIPVRHASAVAFIQRIRNAFTIVDDHDDAWKIAIVIATARRNAIYACARNRAAYGKKSIRRRCINDSAVGGLCESPRNPSGIRSVFISVGRTSACTRDDVLKNPLNPIARKENRVTLFAVLRLAYRFFVADLWIIARIA